MQCSEIKEYIYKQNKIQDILEYLNCHHIKETTEYFSFGMPDGDNIKSTILYKTAYLPVTAYTKNIVDEHGYSDILSLVAYIRNNNNLAQNIKYLCDILNIDYYYDFTEDIPDSLKFTNWILQDNNKQEIEEQTKLKPINEHILSYYYPYPNKLFEDDGISLLTQREFEIGFDLRENVITIPIRDDIGTLVGVKARALEQNAVNKYFYLEKCNKSHILYGFHKTYPFIKKQKQVIVVESEKSVMKLWQNGIKNSVAIACHTLSKTQTEILSRLMLDEIILCYDEDAYRNENGVLSKSDYIKEVKKFIKQQKVSAMIDINKDILDSKQSPVDNMDKFNLMYKQRKRLQ